MAYVIARPSGAWELRETTSTPVGPRSRTLATFRTLTPEVVEQARTRSTRPLGAGEVRRAAHRAGAPVGRSAVDQAASELLAQMAARRRPRPALQRLLRDALREPTVEATDAERAAAAWAAAESRQRGEALRDLLLLADRLPTRRVPKRPRFPRIDSARA